LILNSESTHQRNSLADHRKSGIDPDHGFIGTRPAVPVGGIATLAVTAIWLKIVPAMRRGDRLDSI